MAISVDRWQRRIGAGSAAHGNRQHHILGKQETQLWSLIERADRSACKRWAALNQTSVEESHSGELDQSQLERKVRDLSCQRRKTKVARGCCMGNVHHIVILRYQ